MQTSKFIEILKDKIAEANDNINEINKFHLMSTRTFGYTAFYYDEAQVETALSKLKQWQQVIQDIIKIQYQSDKHENYLRFCNTIKPVKKGFDYKKELPNEYNNGITVLSGIIESINILGDQDMHIGDEEILSDDSKNIFIVHGHDEVKRTAVESFVRSIDYNPIVLFKEPSVGQTIIEKIESNVENICFAIVIYTSCDLGKAKESPVLTPRARQNVVFEHGYMCAHLGRKKVVALLENGVEQPGDLEGVIYIKLDDAGLWQIKVAQEMKAVGLDVDLNNIKL